AYVLFFAIMSSAHFWLPLLAGRRDVQLGRVFTEYFSYSDHFVYWKQLWDTKWGFGYSHSGLGDGMSFQLGRGHLIALAVILIMVVDLRRTRRGFRGRVLAVALAPLPVIFLTTYSSATLWKLLTPISLVQFPWRLLLPAGLLVSVGGAVAAGQYLPRLPVTRI